MTLLAMTPQPPATMTGRWRQAAAGARRNSTTKPDCEADSLPASCRKRSSLNGLA